MIAMTQYIQATKHLHDKHVEFHKIQELVGNRVPQAEWLDINFDLATIGDFDQLHNWLVSRLGHEVVTDTCYDITKLVPSLHKDLERVLDNKDKKAGKLNDGDMAWDAMYYRQIDILESLAKECMDLIEDGYKIKYEVWL